MSVFDITDWMYYYPWAFYPIWAGTTFAIAWYVAITMKTYPRTPDWMEVHCATFKNEAVILDHTRYVGCTFHNVTFLWDGAQTSLTGGCVVTGETKLHTQDGSTRTVLELLRALGMLAPELALENGWDDQKVVALRA